MLSKYKPNSTAFTPPPLVTLKILQKVNLAVLGQFRDFFLLRHFSAIDILVAYMMVFRVKLKKVKR